MKSIIKFFKSLFQTPVGEVATPTKPKRKPAVKRVAIKEPKKKAK